MRIRMPWLCRRVPLVALLSALALAGCASRPATAPLRTIAQPSPCAARPDTLLVLLPGAYSLPEDFVREGFVRSVQEAGLAADLLLVDAHTGYYENRSIVDRLHADVVQPARARGYRQVWLAGISIGAVGAMLYADEHPQEVTGVVALAPFLGSRLSVLDIENAGGLAAWQPPERGPGEALDQRLWRWLKGQTGEASSGHRIEFFQGYGEDDRFAHNNRLLGRALPPSRVYTTPGDHDWPAWTAVWRRIVGVLPVHRGTGCALALSASSPPP
jgi:pimeloyl-ACP methyl ester carboxylesterase